MDQLHSIQQQVTNGFTEIVKFMASKVENPNSPIPGGWTPIHMAARHGFTEIVKFMASKVENPNAPKSDGWTPIHLAARYGFTIHIAASKGDSEIICGPPPKIFHINKNIILYCLSRVSHSPFGGLKLIPNLFIIFPNL